MKLSGAQTVVKTLEELGINTVFGYTGNYAMPVFEALERSALSLVVPTSEVCGAHEADGYYRASGKVAAVLSTSGPGATNLVTGIATAYMDSVPLLAITANVPTYKLGKDSFQEVDITGIVTPVTKYAHIVKDVRELEREIKKAYALATSGRTAPVLIDIPYDVLLGETEYLSLPLPAYRSPEAKAAEISEAARILNDAERPALLVGGGAVGACKAVAALAEKLKAPVFTTLRGIGATDSERVIGTVGSCAPRAYNRLYASADVILALGTRFSDKMHSKPNKRKYIHIDVDNAELDKIVPATSAICARIADVVPALTEKCNERREAWYAPVERPRALSSVVKLAEAVARADLCDTVIATDVGNHQIAMLQALRGKPSEEIVSSLGLGTMGFGLPALIGAMNASGKRGILFTGDGSFNMNVNELATAVEAGLDMSIVIANNRELGMIKNLERRRKDGCGELVTHTPKVNYALIARAFGAKGRKASVANITALLDSKESGVWVYDVKIRG